VELVFTAKTLLCFAAWEFNKEGAEQALPLCEVIRYAFAQRSPAVLKYFAEDNRPQTKLDRDFEKAIFLAAEKEFSLRNRILKSVIS